MKVSFDNQFFFIDLEKKVISLASFFLFLIIQRKEKKLLKIKLLKDTYAYLLQVMQLIEY